MTATHSLSEQVALVERKIEVRRARTRRHWHEVQSDIQRSAQRSARWTPLVGVAAMAWIGFKLARQQGGTPALASRPQGRIGVASLWAALATSALRIAFSSQGKQFWNAWRRGRAGPSP